MSFSALAQVGAGTLKGRITDFDTKESLPFASVILFLNGNQVAGTITIDPAVENNLGVKTANVVIKPLQPNSTYHSGGKGNTFCV